MVKVVNTQIDAVDESLNATPFVMKNYHKFMLDFMTDLNQSQAIKTGKVITKEDDLNVRYGPSVDYGILAKAPKGSTVNIIGEVDDWYLVKYEEPYRNKVGCVLKDYVSVD